MERLEIDLQHITPYGDDAAGTYASIARPTLSFCEGILQALFGITKLKVTLLITDKPMPESYLVRLEFDPDHVPYVIFLDVETISNYREQVFIEVEYTIKKYLPQLVGKDFYISILQ